MNPYRIMRSAFLRWQTPANQRIYRLAFIGVALTGSVYCTTLRANPGAQPGVSKGTPCHLESPCQRCGPSRPNEVMPSPVISLASSASAFHGKRAGVCRSALGPDLAAPSLKHQDASLTTSLLRPQNLGGRWQPGLESAGRVVEGHGEGQPEQSGSPRFAAAHFFGCPCFPCVLPQNL